ncbi:HAD domain-containing protein [Cryobacterium sp. AP23]
MDSNSALILLDVDGVLNPQMVMQKLVIDPSRAALVEQLSRLGSITWATTWSAAHVYHLAQAIGLPGNMAAIAFPPNLHIDPHNPAPTPKLHWVSRWVNRNMSDELSPSTAVIWIDDQLQTDASDWAQTSPHPTLLVRPDPTIGLTAEHLTTVRKFLEELASHRNSEPAEENGRGLPGVGF